MRTWDELGKHWNRCEICGQFIAFADFGDSAVHQLVYPDSEITVETWETFHVDCNWQKPGIGPMAVCKSSPDKGAVERKGNLSQ